MKQGWTIGDVKATAAGKSGGLTAYVPVKDREKKKKRVSRPKGRHLTKEGKQAFCDMCADRGLPFPIPEYKPFLESMGRKHAVDFLFEKDGVKVALEVEGWGHRTGKRFEEDRWKYNNLAIMRIWHLRVRPKDLYKEETFTLIKVFFGL